MERGAGAGGAKAASGGAVAGRRRDGGGGKEEVRERKEARLQRGSEGGEALRGDVIWAPMPPDGLPVR